MKHGGDAGRTARRARPRTRRQDHGRAMTTEIEPTVLIVPGLRQAAANHWQSILAGRIATARCVAPIGRDNLDCQARLDAIDAAVGEIDGPIIVVAHSAGVLSVVRWAQSTRRAVLGALLAAPPDFETPMPEGYPDMPALAAAGWLPTPRGPLPFPSIAALSRDDPLGDYDRIERLAAGWGSRVVDLGAVGHLNPASGFGPWPMAETLIAELAANPRYRRLKGRLKSPRE